MKNVLEAPFIKKFCKTTSNMYRLGWDERNGGNISVLLDEGEVKEYLDTKKVLRVIPTGFNATELKGKYFMVTGTGKYFKNVEEDPETNLGIIRIGEDGTSAELLWGQWEITTILLLILMPLQKREFSSQIFTQIPIAPIAECFPFSADTPLFPRHRS